MKDKSPVGKPVDELPTPCLAVDLDGLEANLRLLADFFRDRPAKLRPHFKSHKCVTLAQHQLKAGGAVGITCAKLSEAEVLVAGGVGDILIANQLVGADKAARLAQLNRQALVRCAVDSPGQLTDLGTAAVAAGVTIGVLVEVDIGMGRCGVAPGKPALHLAQAVDRTDGLRFDGLQGYEGHLVCLPDATERRRRVEAAMAVLVGVRHELAAAGLPCAIVSGGGTGTYDITGAILGIDEVQAGSYALMDASYARIRPEFVCCRQVISTVISTGVGKAVLDVGLKGLGNDFGPPVVVGHPGASVRYVAEEHVVVDNITAHLGDKVRLIPSHGCTTNHLYRRLYATRFDLVEAVWPIEGSGCLE